MNQTTRAMAHLLLLAWKRRGLNDGTAWEWDRGYFQGTRIAVRWYLEHNPGERADFKRWFRHYHGKAPRES